MAPGYHTGLSAARTTTERLRDAYSQEKQHKLMWVLFRCRHRKLSWHFRMCRLHVRSLPGRCAICQDPQGQHAHPPVESADRGSYELVRFQNELLVQAKRLLIARGYALARPSPADCHQGHWEPAAVDCLI